MNKKDVVKEVANRHTDLTQKKIGEIVDDVLEVIKENLVKGDKVLFAGFGSFEVTERAAREGRNPQTGDTVTIPSCKVPKFKPGKALKDYVNQR